MQDVQADIETIVQKLKENNLTVISSRSYFVTGARRTESHSEVPEIVRHIDPFIVEPVGNTWYSAFHLGQTLIMIKVSQSVKVATQAIISMFRLADHQPEDMQTVLIILLKLEYNGFLIDILSDDMLAIYDIESRVSEFEKLGKIVNAPGFRENSYVATIKFKDQTIKVEFSGKNKPVENIPVVSLEDAVNLILSKRG